MNKSDNYENDSALEQLIVNEIKSEPVHQISVSEIKETCQTAISYYTETQSMIDVDFWKVTLHCLSLSSAFFWILSAFIIGSCIAFSSFEEKSGIFPFAYMTAFAPVPVILFAIQELQCHDRNMIQIEKTCKYAPQKIYFARLWLGMAANATGIFLTGNIAFPHYENILQLYFCSFIALFFIGAVALFIMSLSENTIPLSVMLSAWIASAVLILSQEEFFYLILRINTGFLIGITIISMILFTYSTIKVTTKLYA